MKRSISEVSGDPKEGEGEDQGDTKRQCACCRTSEWIINDTIKMVTTKPPEKEEWDARMFRMIFKTQSWSYDFGASVEDIIPSDVRMFATHLERNLTASLKFVDNKRTGQVKMSWNNFNGTLCIANWTKEFEDTFTLNLNPEEVKIVAQGLLSWVKAEEDAEEDAEV